MKKYCISVRVSVYADSEEEARAEVRACLNTGKGHIHGYAIAPLVPCDCEIYQTCSKCKEPKDETRVPKTPPFDYPM